MFAYIRFEPNIPTHPHCLIPITVNSVAIKKLGCKQVSVQQLMKDARVSLETFFGTFFAHIVPASKENENEDFLALRNLEWSSRRMAKEEDFSWENDLMTRSLQRQTSHLAKLGQSFF
jgi:hypothetical protein